MTTKMESAEIFGDIERALPYLEKGGYDGDRNFASVGEDLEISYCLVALPC